MHKLELSKAHLSFKIMMYVDFVINYGLEMLIELNLSCTRHQGRMGPGSRQSSPGLGRPWGAALTIRRRWSTLCPECVANMTIRVVRLHKHSHQGLKCTLPGPISKAKRSPGRDPALGCC